MEGGFFMEEKKTSKSSIINIVDRSKMNISGVNNVGSFDEETISLMTDLGGLVIQGKGLKINKLNVDDGNLIIEGQVTSCVYNDKLENLNKGSFMSRLFK